MSQTYVTRLDGPSVETEVAFDMLRRGLPAYPVVAFLVGIAWGWQGIASVGYAMALVAVNFVLSAVLLSWSARISLGLMMGAALGGFALRLGLLFAAVWLVKDAAWVELVPLGLALIVTHLGLLLWEVRYVSASLAFPTLKPGTAARKEDRSK